MQVNDQFIKQYSICEKKNHSAKEQLSSFGLNKWPDLFKVLQTEFYFICQCGCHFHIVLTMCKYYGIISTHLDNIFTCLWQVIYIKCK